MTDTGREISLHKLAAKFAGGDRDLRNEWKKTLIDAVKAGTLEARIVKTRAPGLPKEVDSPIASREWSSEFSSFQSPRQALTQALTPVSRYFIPSAVAAWLRRSEITNPPALVRIWLGDAWKDPSQEKPKTETQSRGSRLLKSRALEVLCLDGNGWPETLNADELARLWYPDDDRSRGKMETAISRAIEGGELQTDGTRQSRAGISVYELGITTFATPGRNPEPAFTRESLRAWLGSDEPPELVRAWLGETAQPAPPDRECVADDIPGKLPRVAAGRLAIKAAWQIECETNRRASAKEVIARLQAWAENGNEAATLIESMPKKRAVKWLTAKSEERDYGLEACKKTLETWHKSRQ